MTAAAYAWLVRRSVRSPRCADRNACPSRTTQTVALSAGPHASSGTGGGDRQRDRQRDVPARAPQRHRTTCGHRHDGIVRAGGDAPVVHEERVGDASQPVQRLVVVADQWLTRDVGTGEHQRPGHHSHQQGVQGRIGKQQAEGAAARGDRRSDGRPGSAGDDHDGSGRVGEQGAVDLGRAAEPIDLREIGNQEGEGAVRPALSFPQSRDRRLVGGIDREVVAADPLERDDVPGAQQRSRLGQRLARPLAPSRIEQPELRAAGGAAQRLGVEASVRRIVVLRLALGAQGEAGHRRAQPVVGHRLDDGEAGAAVGAGDERVPVASVARVGELGQAGLAHCRVGGQQGGCRARCVTGQHDELGRTGRRHLLRRHGVDPRQRGRRAQASQQCLYPIRVCLDLEQDTLLVVPDPAGQPERAGLPPHERPEPDPLHQPGDPHPQPDRPGAVGGHAAIMRESQAHPRRSGTGTPTTPLSTMTPGHLCFTWATGCLGRRQRRSRLLPGRLKNGSEGFSCSRRRSRRIGGE